MLQRLFGYPDPSSRDYGRLEAFSDSVFTIAATLLGFQLVVPSLDEPVTDGQLWRAPLDNWPADVSFLLSFFSILIMWVNHHAIFRVMERVDQTITFANGFLLMLVTAVPFATENLAAYLNTGAAEIAVAIYAGLFVLVSLAYNLLWWRIAWEGRRLHPAHDPRAVRTFSISLLAGLPVYLIATAVAFWSPYVSLAICLSLWLFWSATPFDPLTERGDGSATG